MMNQTSPTKLYIAICDDEPWILETIRNLCIQTLMNQYEVEIHTACSAKELLSIQIPFHIAILDVQMEECDGVELARKLMDKNIQCRIIFVSGFLTKVSYVYEVPHFCFILKDQIKENLPVFLKRAADLAAEESGKKICLSIGKQLETIQLKDIIFLERRGHLTYITLTDGRTIQTKEKLDDLMKRIGSSDFTRCHASYSVNLRCIQRMEVNCFLMDGDYWVPISRKYEKTCESDFYSYLSDSL